MKYKSILWIGFLSCFGIMVCGLMLLPIGEANFIPVFMIAVGSALLTVFNLEIENTRKKEKKK